MDLLPARAAEVHVEDRANTSKANASRTGSNDPSPEYVAAEPGATPESSRRPVSPVKDPESEAVSPPVEYALGAPSPFGDE